MSEYAAKIARNWVGGVEPTKNTRLWAGTFRPDSNYIGGVNTKDPDAPRALYSYGPHYPVAIAHQQEDMFGYWVNETPYYINDEDRYNCEYYGGHGRMMAGYYQPRRKATPSPTTKNHVEEVERVLRSAGYQRTDITKQVVTEGTDGEDLIHTMRLWTLYGI